MILIPLLSTTNICEWNSPSGIIQWFNPAVFPFPHTPRIEQTNWNQFEPHGRLFVTIWMFFRAIFTRRISPAEQISKRLVKIQSSHAYQTLNWLPRRSGSLFRNSMAMKNSFFSCLQASHPHAVYSNSADFKLNCMQMLFFSCPCPALLSK